MYKKSYPFENGQKFRVLCVSKHENSERDSEMGWWGESVWHLPVNGLRSERFAPGTASATVRELPTGTFLDFKGRVYPFLHVRNGLDGQALVIGIRYTDEAPYTCWELYTDTPSPEPDHGEIANSQTIENAAASILGRKFLYWFMR